MTEGDTEVGWLFWLYLLGLWRGPRQETVTPKPTSQVPHHVTAPLGCSTRNRALPSAQPGCALPTERLLFVLFHYVTGWKSGRECYFCFAGQRGRRKNEPVFHSSPPTLGHLCINFLLSQKLLKPFARSVNEQKAKSNPFRPSLRPGKSLTKQNSPVSSKSWLFRLSSPPLFFPSFQTSVLLWSQACWSRRQDIFTGTKTKIQWPTFSFLALTQSRGGRLNPV